MVRASPRDTVPKKRWPESTSSTVVKVPGSACRAICANADSGMSAKAATSSAETKPRARMVSSLSRKQPDLRIRPHQFFRGCRLEPVRLEPVRLESHSTSTWLKMSQARRLRGRPALQVAMALTAVLCLAEAAGRAQPLDGLPPVVGASEVFVADERSGFGLRGFDPVSYFLGPMPLPGREGVELIWRGVAWRFASEANREAFARDPEVYAPRIG